MFWRLSNNILVSLKKIEILNSNRMVWAFSFTKRSGEGEDEEEKRASNSIHVVDKLFVLDRNIVLFFNSYVMGILQQIFFRVYCQFIPSAFSCSTSSLGTLLSAS